MSDKCQIDFLAINESLHTFAEKFVSMKRFLFLLMLAFLAIMAYVSVHEKEDDTPLPQKLERAMRLAQMKEYQDEDYDYVVRYPSFFEQTL